MSHSERMAELKAGIRSVLITFQKGCYLSEFLRTFGSLLGRLPTRELGFRDDIELLNSMPDVVRLRQSRMGEPHLMGIADEKSKHIQSMVCKQKPAKLKLPARAPRNSRFYDAYSSPAPRFCGTQKIPQFNVSALPSFQFSDTKSKPFQSTNNVQSLPKTLPKPTLEIKQSPQEEVISLVKHYKKGIPLDEILYEYEVMYKKSFSLSAYKFKSIKECIEDISELDIVYQDNIPFAIYQPESTKLSEKVPVTSAMSSNATVAQNHVSMSYTAPAASAKAAKTQAVNEAIIHQRERHAIVKQELELKVQVLKEQLKFQKKLNEILEMNPSVLSFNIKTAVNK